MGQSTGSTGASASGTAGTADSTSTSKEDSTEDAVDSASQYSTDVIAFTISPDENRLLSVSVDELDINSVELGQKAVVTFDAIEDQEFEDTVIQQEINDSHRNDPKPACLCISLQNAENKQIQDAAGESQANSDI